ncbi:SDR family oxidoreductase [Salisediminibacterium halotolerans]|uniref:NAD(P)-dependent dehydrogenase, short-chain alcohol dehydrogenase family n=1 Tax=Salisediminibacterium halotolerans TaxID=517425 RepID=A0A1H9U9D4_9BACI|nr:SDR family oxidoreductase [Salisediminibacterium haloalkalitolerans]SES05767.1 NAD(P)-dependent dehydrogenase, short-chain alcohol dehydrogenase family [Salisediminibacterium haloalkalitolerans]
MKLAGKTAVVTGAASGMGRAIVELYGAEGANVVVADINEEGVKEVAAEIEKNGGKAASFTVNVGKIDEVKKLIAFAVETYGTLDVLVNNAGVMDGFEPVGEISDEKWDRIFDINTKGVMAAMREVIPIFREKGAGNIINIASTGGENGAHAGVAYGASKHAVVGMTKNTGFMYAEEGIRCNAIAPGAVNTNIGTSMTNISEFGMARCGKTHALSPRTGEASEIAAAALFLASEESSFVNGVVLTVDGGWTASF